MKKFISTITLQGQGAQQCCYRDAAGKDTPRVPTAFPIIQQISDAVTAGEQIHVVTVVVGGPENNPNYDSFVAELEDLKAARNFTYVHTVIEKANDESIDTIISLFGAVTGHVADGDRLYACVTYGTKPMSMVITMALHYAYRIKADVVVEAVCYGLRDWSAPEPTGTLYDTTALFYIDCLIDRIANMKVADPEAALRALIQMENE